jgi:hypothetical protein
VWIPYFNRDKTYTRKKLFLDNRIFYKNKTRGVFAKNNKKNKKNKKTKYFYCFQENPRYNLSIYFKTNKKICKKKKRIEKTKNITKSKPKKSQKKQDINLDSSENNRYFVIITNKKKYSSFYIS